MLFLQNNFCTIWSQHLPSHEPQKLQCWKMCLSDVAIPTAVEPNLQEALGEATVLSLMAAHIILYTHH